MSSDSIPDEVCEFILGHIESIAQLEALLLLRREPERSWRERDVAERLYIGHLPASEVLARLSAQGLLAVAEDGYRYQPCTSELESIVGRVAEVYARQLIPVTHLIHAKPSRIREFAEAFKFRKEP
jgi:hypothetical protein